MAAIGARIGEEERAGKDSKPVACGLAFNPLRGAGARRRSAARR
jgi:hypothetical protein